MSFFSSGSLSLSHKFFSISADLSYLSHSFFSFPLPPAFFQFLKVSVCPFHLRFSPSPPDGWEALPSLFPGSLLLQLYVTIFLFLSHPPIWMLIAILWVYLKHHIVCEEIRTTGSSFPSSSVTWDTHGFFGQVVSPGSRMRSQL